MIHKTVIRDAKQYFFICKTLSEDETTQTANSLQLISVCGPTLALTR